MGIGEGVEGVEGGNKGRGKRGAMARQREGMDGRAGQKQEWRHGYMLRLLDDGALLVLLAGGCLVLGNLFHVHLPRVVGVGYSLPAPHHFMSY